MQYNRSTARVSTHEPWQLDMDGNNNHVGAESSSTFYMIGLCIRWSWSGQIADSVCWASSPKCLLLKNGKKLGLPQFFEKKELWKTHSNKYIAPVGAMKKKETTQRCCACKGNDAFCVAYVWAKSGAGTWERTAALRAGQALVHSRYGGDCWGNRRNWFLSGGWRQWLTYV